MLDTIVAPGTRSFEWHPHWNGRAQQAGGFKDGEGNFFFAWFSERGAVVRGFDHESKISPYRKDPPEVWPGMFRGLPPSLACEMTEPTLSLDETTFCFWAEGTSLDWTSGAAANDAHGVREAKVTDEVDGSASLLQCFRLSFVRWAATYYGTDLDPTALRRLWWNEPLDWETLERLNVDFDERAVREEAELLEWALDLSKQDIRTTPPRSGPVRFSKAELERDVVMELECARLGRPSASPVVRPPSSLRPGVGLEFVVRREPAGVVLRIGDRAVAATDEDVFDELLALVRARLEH